MDADGGAARLDAPTISVAMATYNGERYLEEQLESLAAQVVLPAELVVVDDASTDATVAIVERFAARAAFPVRITRNPTTLGWGQNFVRAISLCTASLIAPCDQDDVWHPDKLATCARWFAEHPDLALLVHSCRVTDVRLTPTKERLPHFRRTRIVPPEDLPFGFAHHGMALVFPRWLFTSVPFEDRPLAVDRGAPKQINHDSWIAFLAMLAGPVALLADELCLYRRHEANATPLRLPTGGDQGVAGLFDVDAKASAYAVLAGRHAAAAAYLDEVEPRMPGVEPSVVRQRARGRADQHRRAARNFRARADSVGRAASRPRRLARVARLVVAGGYGARRSAGLGLVSLGVDLVTTLCLGRRAAPRDDDRPSVADGG